MEEGHFPPKVPADTRGKGKEEAANAHTRVSTRNSVLNLAKENGAISGGPHFQNDQKISKADPHQLNVSARYKIYNFKFVILSSNYNYYKKFLPSIIKNTAFIFFIEIITLDIFG